MTERRLVRAVAWQRLDVPGAESCGLWAEGAGGWQLDGTVLVSLESIPYDARFVVRCDHAFLTRRTAIVLTSGEQTRALTLEVDAGSWAARRRDFRDKHEETFELPQVTGCRDVDLGFTPATNTMPIRRLGLNVGESAEINAAWVRFPELTVERLPQRYTRLAENRYRYESRDSGFTAELEVDEEGLVVTYEGLWERVGSSDG